jgi:hypothetical protein
MGTVKKMYKTSMLTSFRLLILAVALFFFYDFYLETYSYAKFFNEGKYGPLAVLKFHYRYPAEFISFFFLVIVPAFYYSLIRGVKFCEKGFYYNRGLPFLNKFVPYSDVKSYKLLHPNVAITITTEKGDLFVVVDNNIERVIAILDQHNIHGNLAQDEFVKLFTNFKKFVYIVFAFTILLFLVKKLGLFQIGF